MKLVRNQTHLQKYLQKYLTMNKQGHIDQWSLFQALK